MGHHWFKNHMRSKRKAFLWIWRMWGFIILVILAIVFTTPCLAINISGCSVLNQPGETYYLTADIINSGTSHCINIYANNVTLDCQWHRIDGDDSADYGIYIYRSSQETTNITIKNCIVTDWYSANIYFENASGNTLENIVANSGRGYGIYLYYSSSNILQNITANSNSLYGIYLSHSSSNILQNVTVKENQYYDIYFYASSPSHCNNLLQNVTGSGDRPIEYYNLSLIHI